LLLLFRDLALRDSGRCGVGHGHLSAYGGTLIAIYFMQVDLWFH
jgi:hypothetical protein